MARKRIIDPTFWEDEEIGLKWPPLARLFYIGLWNFADDEGRIKAHPALLKSQIFPYERKVDIEKLKKIVSSKVQWYEVSGSQYGFVRNFLKHQRIDRPTPSKLPAPPPFDEPSSNPQRDVLPNISKEKLSKDKLIEDKVKHLDFVLLTDKEYKKLCELFGKSQADIMIEKLNNYIGSKGKKYKSHYFTILNWAGKDGIRQQRKIEVPKHIKEFKDPKPEEIKKVQNLVKNVTKKMGIK